MHDVSAGAPKSNIGSDWDHDALRIEGVLLTDQSHDHRTVGASLRAQVLFDELTRYVQGGWIDGFDTRRRHAGPMYAGKCDDGQDHDNQGNRHSCPTFLSPRGRAVFAA